jgi:hypothetical protein
MSDDKHRCYERGPLMKREEVLQVLAAQRTQWGTLKVKSLALFGSVARDEARTDSDIDLLAEFEGPATFDQYMKLKTFLEGLLGGSVDLLTHKGIRPELVPHIEKEAVYVS